ncbi:MAG: hypothetical protein C0503_03600 [Gemmatimonas sp.]|nr:hypothetical protein [Gemmatimonas sp.]
MGFSAALVPRLARAAAGVLLLAVAVACGGGARSGSGTSTTAPATTRPASEWGRAASPTTSASVGCGPALEREWQELRLARYVPADRSRAQVEQVLLSEARVLAVQQAVGITVATTTSRTQYEAMANGTSREYRDHFFELYAQDAAGVIVEERHRVMRVGQDSIGVIYEARVACDAGSAAAGFVGRVETDQLVYRDSSIVTIRVEASDPARLYLFSVAQDGSARLIFPNPLDTANQLAGGAMRQVPRDGAPYRLSATLDPRFGADQSELLLGIFYTGTGPAPFRASDARDDRVFTLEEINRVLLRIPRAERARVATGYEIRRR